LGWLGVGLGLAELAAPDRTARMIGIRSAGRNRALMRALGLREIASGVAILARPGSASRVWTRVAGDAIDLALLGTALTARGTQRPRTAAATAAVLGVAALDVRGVQRLARVPDGAKRGTIHVRKSITVNRSPEDVYRFWRQLDSLPQFMRHLESVQVTGERQSRWRARGPAGTTLEWDAEITDDRPNEVIAWRALEHADVDNSGSVHFQPAPGGRGTEVTVELRYAPPGGKASAALAKLFRKEPGQEVHDDLRAFKQVMETGEVLRSDATAQEAS
jgi:uncharacterized membrane protein